MVDSLRHGEKHDAPLPCQRVAPSGIEDNPAAGWAPPSNQLPEYHEDHHHRPCCFLENPHYRFLPCEATTTMATTSLGCATLSRSGTKAAATIAQLSDGSVYRTDGQVADFNIKGEPVRMSREVAEFWCHPLDPVRLVPVER